MGVWQGKIDLGRRQGRRAGFQAGRARHGGDRGSAADRGDRQGRSPLSGGAAAARPARRAGIHVRRSLDGGRFRPCDRERPPRVKLLRLDADLPLDNYYAHPVEGLHALVDLAPSRSCKSRIISRRDGDYIPVPRMPLNFDADVLTEFRAPSAPLDVVQPAGAGFTRRRQQGHMGELGLPGRVQRPRGAGAAHRRLHARRPAPADPLPRLDRRDGRALRHAGAQPLPQERFRSAARSASAAWPIR